MERPLLVFLIESPKIFVMDPSSIPSQDLDFPVLNHGKFLLVPGLSNVMPYA